MVKSSMQRYIENYDDGRATPAEDMPSIDRSKPDPWLEKWKREHGWDFSAVVPRRRS